MTVTASFFDTSVADTLKQDLVAMIKDRDQAAPRSQQRELGPSEIGHPCLRRMAYGLMRVQRCNPSFDPLPAIIGTATHKWLESAASYANTVLGRQRWLVETRVNIASWLSGSCDLYDTDTHTVIDYKVPGSTRMKTYKADPGQLYRTQVHLYGKGFRNAGQPVQNVAIMFIPRGGTLASAHLWTEPYDEAIADECLERRNQVVALLSDFNVEANPERYEWFSRTDYDCMFCPFFAPTPDGPLQCGGAQ